MQPLDGAAPASSVATAAGIAMLTKTMPAPTASVEAETSLDGWLVPPNTEGRRKRGRGPGRRTDAMAQQPLVELVEQFCTYQRKQRGKTEGGVRTYHWNLDHFLRFVQKREARPARAEDVNATMIQAWMDEMARDNLALSTLRTRQSTVSSLGAWMVKRGILSSNPVAVLDRPPQRREPPRQVPGSDLMDRLIQAAREGGHPRDVVIFLLLLFTGMRRESVATLRIRNLYPEWGLRAVPVKGGKTRDIPLPAAVSQYIKEYVEKWVAQQHGPLTPDTPIFWSTWGQRHRGLVSRPMTGKNIWGLTRPRRG